MKRNCLRMMISVACLFLLGTGCGTAPTGRDVAVTIEPQRYFAERIAGDKFSIHTIVPSGQSPEVYDPTPRQMLRVGRCRAYLRIGYIGFEMAWMQRIRDINPQMQVFDLSEGFDFLKEEEAEHEGEDVQHAHHPGGVDPHIWTSVVGARVLAKNTLAAFVALDPDNAAYYQQNYALLEAEIDETEAVIRQKLAAVAPCAFVVYHPALTYFAAEFDLRQLCIEEDGKEPSPAQFKRLIDAAKAQQVKVVFIQREFDVKNTEQIALAIGCRTVVIDPLSYHWSREMISMANALADE